ncbi:MAG: BTAD domain-containing putative transcriptional regulator [Egibacteraceae bacterium]
MLGPLLVSDGDRVVELGGPRQRAILAMLLLDANRVVSMDRLIDGIWGDGPPAQATGTVQAYVSNLRKALEPARRPGEPARVLISRAPGYCLKAAPDDVDWLRFGRLADQARAARAAGDLEVADGLLTQARDLWRGPALADFGSEPFAEHERAHLEELRLSAVEDHTEVRLALRRHDEIAADLERVVAEHPLRERLRGLLMVALYRAGRQADALAAYADVRRRLAGELGIDPGASLRRLQEQILRQDPKLDWEQPLPTVAAARPRPVTGPVHNAPAAFVGRNPELATLRRHLDATQAGSGRVVLVEGEPGIGKTRLAEIVATEAASRGFRALWGRCFEGEGAPSLWPWTQVLRQVHEARDLTALVPWGGQLDPQDARAHLNQALSDLLGQLAVARPLLVVLDDLHWADVASLQLLEFLAATLAGTRILVLAAYREVDIPLSGRLTSTLGVLARLPGADRVALRGMSVDEVAQMIRERAASQPAPPLAAAVHRRTDGNPFFVTELLRLSDPQRLLDGPVPAGVRDVIRHRIARLPPTAQQLLATAAITGREFDLGLVVGLCGFDADTGLEAAEAALIHRAITGIPEQVSRYGFTHALVRETLAGDLTPIQRARLHTRVAEALLATHGEDGEHALAVAEHLWASLPAGDAALTLRALVRAAERAWDGLAYEQTEDLLARAATLARSLPPATAVPDLDLDVHIRLGSVSSVRHGYTAEVRDAFARARMLGERLGRPGSLLPALWGLGATAVVRGHLATARELTDAALEEARHVASPHALAAGHQGVGIVAFYQGRLAEARRHFADSLAAWQGVSQPPALASGPPANTRPDVMAPCYDALAACLTGDAAGAGKRIALALRAAESTGQPYALAFAHSFHARLAVLQRDPDTAEQAAAKAIAVAEAHRFPLLIEHAAIPKGWAEAWRGSPERGLGHDRGGAHRAGDVRSADPDAVPPGAAGGGTPAARRPHTRG